MLMVGLQPLPSGESVGPKYWQWMIIPSGARGLASAWPECFEILLTGFEDLRAVGFPTELRVKLVEPVPELCFLRCRRGHEGPFEPPERVKGLAVIPVLQDVFEDGHAEEALLHHERHQVVKLYRLTAGLCRGAERGARSVTQWILALIRMNMDVHSRCRGAVRS